MAMAERTLPSGRRMDVGIRTYRTTA